MAVLLASVCGVVADMWWRKPCYETTMKLKNDDITVEECQQIIIQELRHIQSKLDELSRKDLSSCASLLKDGLVFLEKCLRNLESIPVTPNKSMNINLETLVKALAMKQKQLFNHAMGCFEYARERSTSAFYDPALDLDNKLFVMKIRVTASIFESLDNLDVAAHVGKLALDELNKMPGVQEAFSVSLQGGIKAHFNKAKRLELVSSVLMINLVVYNFTKYFTKVLLDVVNWSMVKIGRVSYLPILGLQQRLTSWAITNVGEQVPLIEPDCFLSKVDIAFGLTSTKELLTASRSLFINLSDMLQPFYDSGFRKGETELSEFKLISFAVDQEDNMYILTRKGLGNEINYELLILDVYGDVKSQKPLEFLNGTRYNSISIAVPAKKNDKVIIAYGVNRTYAIRAYDYVKDTVETLVHKTHLQHSVLLTHLAITKTSDIVAAGVSGNSLEIFNKLGEPKKTIMTPDNYTLVAVVFRYCTNEIIVLAKNEKNEIVLISYCKAEEFQPKEIYLGFDAAECHPKLFSHPMGPMAIELKRKIYFM